MSWLTCYLLAILLEGIHGMSSFINLTVYASDSTNKVVWGDSLASVINTNYQKTHSWRVLTQITVIPDHLQIAFTVWPPDVILVKCSNSGVAHMLDMKMARLCYCYTEEEKIMPCLGKLFDDDTYYQVISQLMKKEAWVQVLYIGDSSLGGELASVTTGMVTSSVTCTELPGSLSQFLDNYYLPDVDYYNVIVDCPERNIASIMKMVYAVPGRKINVNWVFVRVDVDVDVFRYFSTMKEGENAAFLMTSSLTTSSHLFAYLTDKRDRYLFDVDISWCLTDCYKDNRIMRRVHVIGSSDVINQDIPIAPCRFTQFYGRHMLVTCASYKPFYYTRRVGNKTLHLGIDVNILRTLSEEFNFSYTLVPAIDGTWGTDDGNGSWNGMIGMVYRKEVEMAISGITITSYRDDVIDYLYPNWEASSAVILRLRSFKWLYFIKAFTGNTWLAILLTPVFMAVALLVFKFFDNLIFGENYVWLVLDGGRVVRRFRIERHLTGNKSAASLDQTQQSSGQAIAYGDNLKTKTCQTNSSHNLASTVVRALIQIFDTFQGYYFILFGGLLLQGNSIQLRSSSYRLVYGSFWFFVIIVTATYSGNLTASLAVKSFKLPFSTLDELASNGDYFFQVRVGAFREQIFREARGGVYKRLWDKIQKNPKESLITNQTLAYQRVLEGGYTYTASKIRLDEIVRSTGRSDLVILKETYFKTGKALVVQDGVPYRKKFYDVVLRLMQSGIVNYWTRRHTTKDKRKLTGTVAHNDPISLSDVYLVFAGVLAPGLAIALFGLLTEQGIAYVHRYWRNKR